MQSSPRPWISTAGSIIFNEHDSVISTLHLVYLIWVFTIHVNCIWKICTTHDKENDYNYAA